MARAIDGDELLGIERLLDTDVVRQSKTASWLLDQVLHDIQAIPTLTPPNEWVSVDNKLPKNGVPILIGNPHWDYPVVASCAGYGVWMDSWHQKMTFTPTYWMPLPERPKEDE
mgnify:CR=1 FL=1